MKKQSNTQREWKLVVLPPVLQPEGGKTVSDLMAELNGSLKIRSGRITIVEKRW